MKIDLSLGFASSQGLSEQNISPDEYLFRMDGRQSFDATLRVKRGGEENFQSGLIKEVT